MNPFIQIFEVREPFGDIYVLPPLDVLTDSGDCDVPAAPQMTSVYPGSVGWFTVPGATGYIIERNLNGTLYTQIGTVEGSEGEELVWNDVAVSHFGYYRVIAVNACGNSAPSAPMDLHNPLQIGSGDSSCILWDAGASSSPASSSASSSVPLPPDPSGDDFYAGVLFLTGGAADLQVDTPGTETHNDGDWTAVHSHASGMTSLECQRAFITDFDVLDCASLLGVNASDNLLTSIDLTSNTALVTVVFSNNQLTSINVASMPTLEAIWFNGNAGLTSFVQPGGANLTSVRLQGCALNEATVDAVLAAAVATGLFGGTIDLSGGTNSVPSAQGLADIATLTDNVTYFWDITVNS